MLLRVICVWSKGEILWADETILCYALGYTHCSLSLVFSCNFSFNLSHLSENRFWLPMGFLTEMDVAV